MKFTEPTPGNFIAEALVTQWIQHERRYREQVAEARKVGTPWVGMMAHADQLSECRRELQTAFGLRKEADDTSNPHTQAPPMVAGQVAREILAMGPAPLEGIDPTTGHYNDCDINDRNPDGIRKPCNCNAGADVLVRSLSLTELFDAYRLAKADDTDKGYQCAKHFRREILRRHEASQQNTKP